jgi:hypothetical protein
VEESQVRGYYCFVQEKDDMAKMKKVDSMLRGPGKWT